MRILNLISGTVAMASRYQRKSESLFRSALLTVLTISGLCITSPALAACDLTVNATWAQTIANQLATGPVTLKTSATTCTGPGGITANGNGDIFINAPLTLTGNHTLTIDAYRSVIINSSATATKTSLVISTNDGGSGGLLMTGPGAKVTMGTGTLTINSNAYTLIKTNAQLQAMTSGYYALNGDLKFVGKANFKPIGWTSTSNNSSPTAFNGALEGLGHSITGLSIQPGASNYVGLFSELGDFSHTPAEVRNLTLVGGDLKIDDSFEYAGSVTGFCLVCRITNVVSTTTINAGNSTNSIGGIAGRMHFTFIYDNFLQYTAFAGSIVGGNSTQYVGGVVGVEAAGTIDRSWAAAQIVVGTDTFAIGGLVGASLESSMTNSFSQSTVKVGANSFAAGGLAGVGRSAIISNTYASGLVSGDTGAGGLGGLVGSSTTADTVTASYWDKQTTGQTTSPDGTGKTTAQMQTTGTFSGWDFTKVWTTPSAGVYPRLRGMALPVSWKVANATAKQGTLPVAGAVTLRGIRSADAAQATPVLTIRNIRGIAVTLSTATPAGVYQELVTALSGSSAAFYLLSGVTDGIGTLTVTK